MYILKMKVEIVFLLVGLAFCICGCGEDFDDSADELGLAFDSPAIGGRPSPSFNVTPIFCRSLQRDAPLPAAMSPTDQKMLISGRMPPFKREGNMVP